MNYLRKIRWARGVIGGIAAALVACASTVTLAQDSVEWLTLTMVTSKRL